MKISMVIPCYTLNDSLEEMAINCVASYRDQVDQLIIVEDGGNYSSQLKKLADIYIYSKANLGFTKAVNRGWRNSDGNFTMIVSSDTTLLHHGNISDLCIKDKVSSPEISNQYIDRLAGPFFCVPKEITIKRGMLREELHTYSSDSEYDERVKDIFVKVPSVKIFHEQAKTVTVAGIEGGEQQHKDRLIYQQLIDEGKI